MVREKEGNHDRNVNDERGTKIPRVKWKRYDWIPGAKERLAISDFQDEKEAISSFSTTE